MRFFLNSKMWFWSSWHLKVYYIAVAKFLCLVKTAQKVWQNTFAQRKSALRAPRRKYEVIDLRNVQA